MNAYCIAKSASKFDYNHILRHFFCAKRAIREI